MKLMNRKEFLFITKSLVCSLFYFGINPLSLSGKSKDRPLVPLNTELSKIQIIYASFHGSTAQIAEYMGKKLEKIGISVSVKSIDDDIDFTACNGIIMGAPIHRGKWMTEAEEYIKKHSKKLEQLPFACFYTCMSKAKQPPSKDTLDELSSYQSAMADLFPTLSPSHIGSFAGVLDYDKCSFLAKLVMWSILSKNDLEAGDYRDWQAIEKWLSFTTNYLISENTLKQAKV